MRRAVIIINPDNGGIIGVFHLVDGLGQHLFDTLDGHGCVRLMIAENVSLQIIPDTLTKEVVDFIEERLGPAVRGFKSPGRG